MKKLFLFLLLSVGVLSAGATRLVVVRTDGTEQLHDIAAIGKWVFVGETALQLTDHAGNLLAEEPLADIRKIVFSEQDTAIGADSQVPDGQILVCPNPTHDVLFVQGIDVQMLRVFDLQGRLLKTATGTEIAVSELANGTYLLQIGTQVVRFIKQ